MNDFDDRISRHLENQASTIDVFGGDLAAVVTRARQRRQRRRVVSVAALAVVVGAGAAVAINQREGKDQAPIDNVGPEPAGSAESSLQWTTVEPASALGWAQSLSVGPDGTLYALSTEPGAQKPDEFYQPTPQILYSSADGVEWAAGGAPADLWASSLEASGGRLYAVGTGPAGAAAGEPYDLQVAASDDGGGTWTNSTLPLDIVGLKDRFGPQVYVGPAQLAVAPNGAVLAVTTVTAWADPVELLPGDVDQRWGVTQTATGFDLYGPPADLDAEAAEVCPADWTLQETAPPGAIESAANGPRGVPPPTTALGGAFDTVTPAVVGNTGDLWCVSTDGSEANPVWPGAVAGPVARSFTWDELGVEPELQQLIGGQVRAFLATDGVNFEEVSLEVPGDGLLGAVEPFATPDGFAVVASRSPYAKGPDGPYPAGMVTVLTSPDGRTWAPHTAGDLTGTFRSVGLMGESLAFVLDDESGTARLALGTAGGTWSLSDPLEAFEQRDPGAFVSDIVVGRLGAAALIGVNRDPIFESGGVDIAGDGGYTLHLLDRAGAAQLLDESGAIVAETPSLYDRARSPDFAFDGTTLDVRDPVSGEVLVTFDGRELEQASADAFDGPSTTTWYVAHSVDGANWSVEPLADLLGEEPTFALVAMTPTNVVVRASFSTPDPTVPDRSVALVGTPAG